MQHVDPRLQVQELLALFLVEDRVMLFDFVLLLNQIEFPSHQLEVSRFTPPRIDDLRLKIRQIAADVGNLKLHQGSLVLDRKQSFLKS